MYVRFNKERRGYDFVSTATIDYDDGTRIIVSEDKTISVGTVRGSTRHEAKAEEVVDALMAKAGTK